MEGFLYWSLGELSLVTKALNTCLTRESPAITHVRSPLSLSGCERDTDDEVLRELFRVVALKNFSGYSLGLWVLLGVSRGFQSLVRVCFVSGFCGLTVKD